MADAKEWYIADEKNKEPLGPLSTEEVMAMLIQEKLSWDDVIWTPDLSERKWRRVFEFRDFSKQFKKPPTFPPPKKFSSKKGVSLPSLKLLRDSGGLDQANLYRRYPRAPLKARVIMHNNFVVSVGKTKDISERGSFVIINDADQFDLGMEVTATFRNLPGSIGTVSSSAVIIRKVPQESGGVGLGLFFYRLSPKLRRQLAGYVINTLREMGEGKEKEKEVS